MNKKELIIEVQEQLKIDTISASKDVLEGVLNAIKSGLSKDGKIQLVGFGTFSISERKARDGINPRTKEVIKIPASKSVKFKASKEFLS